MPGSFRIASLLGIPLYINVSWLVIFAVVTISLAHGQFPAVFPGWPAPLALAVAVVTSLLFFASIVIHEMAHSLVARSIGLPVRSITLFILGGVAQIMRDATHPGAELAMAAAGPLASFALSALFAAIWAVSRDAWEPVPAVAGWLAFNNFVLGTFNMLPGYPMDGGRVLRSLLWWATGNRRLATRIAVFIGRGMAYGMIALGIIIIVLNPLQYLNGAQFAFVGWFLNMAASASGRQARLRDALEGYTAGDLMSPDMVSVPGHLPVQRVVEEYLSPEVLRRGLVVVDGSRLRGLVSLSDLHRVPKQRRAYTAVSNAMTPVARLSAIDPAMPALAALEEMEEHSVSQLPVVRAGVLTGVVTRFALLRPLQLQKVVW